LLRRTFSKASIGAGTRGAASPRRSAVAALLGFIDRDYFLLFMFAYDPEWRHFSPGQVVMAKAIEWCMQHRLVTFDFQKGEEEYKAIWCDAEHALYDHFVPLTLEGRAIAAWHAAGPHRFVSRPWFRRLGACLPTRLRGAVAARFQANAELMADMQPGD
jgi:CelD/BcsL family acetyltransferase involved in cellulose biosynthesis